MKPKIYEVEFVNENNMKIGDTFIVIDECGADVYKQKFPRNWMVGMVLDGAGEKRYVSINKSSYKIISETYGADTKSWIDKKIEYIGQQKCGAMLGKIFKPVA